jgi:hypothetical protein
MLIIKRRVATRSLTVLERRGFIEAFGLKTVLS